MSELTDQQIESLRGVFRAMIGPYALIMPREDVVAMHARMQKRIDDMSREYNRCLDSFDDAMQKQGVRRITEPPTNRPANVAKSSTVAERVDPETVAKLRERFGGEKS